MVRELAVLMCNLSGNDGILSGLWCLDKGVQALVLFESRSQRQAVSMYAAILGLMHVQCVNIVHMQAESHKHRAGW